VPISSLTLEITEGQLMSDPRSQLDILARLHLKGVRLSIDDFGVGYSSLALLRDLPFDELKIDRSFVHRAFDDSESGAILATSLELARQFQMQAVGEGVHDLADWNFLSSSGCDIAQGYFIAEPMHGDRLKSWANEWKSRCTPLLRRN
jgi:EAL domain-containing protein (putative c-di-GMP-specific phosphodiesterase class I)